LVIERVRGRRRRRRRSCLLKDECEMNERIK
jgi:hypothetical protein